MKDKWNSRDNKESSDNDIENTRDSIDRRDTWITRDTQDTRDTRDTRDTWITRDAWITRSPENIGDTGDTKDTGVTRDAWITRDSWDTRNSKNIEEDAKNTSPSSTIENIEAPHYTRRSQHNRSAKNSSDNSDSSNLDNSVHNNKDVSFTRRAFLAGGIIALTGAALYGMRSVIPVKNTPTPISEITMPTAIDPTPVYTFKLSPRFDPNFPDVKLRRHPYPYKASLAITSDIDGTPPDKFDQLHRFLNTREKTPLGPGLGLDIGDSCWMVVNNNLPGIIDPLNHGFPDQMSYWSQLNTKKEYAASKIRKYINCGWIDSIHTYGDFNRESETDITFTREIAKNCIMEWQEKGLKFSVWIDHGNVNNVQNFGSAGKSIPDYQQGDNPESPYYHTDLLIPYGGIRFVWNSSRSGAESQFSLPDLLYPINLRDGQRVWGFHRYCTRGSLPNGYPDFVWSPYTLARTDITPQLDQLINTEGFTSIAQHMGSSNMTKTALPEGAVAPLSEIAKRYRDGKILVARTSRLLQYNRINNFLMFHVEKQSESIAIIIDKILDPHLGEFIPTSDDLMGITFYTPQPARTRIFIGQSPAPEGLIRRNAPDHTGHPSISFRWYTEDINDYSRLE